MISSIDYPEHDIEEVCSGNPTALLIIYRYRSPNIYTIGRLLELDKHIFLQGHPTVGVHQTFLNPSHY